MSNKIDKFSLSETAITEACHAWQSGGTMGLSLWLSRYKPHFSVKDYSDLIELVRDETNDTTDYSKE